MVTFVVVLVILRSSMLFKMLSKLFRRLYEC